MSRNLSRQQRHTREREHSGKQARVTRRAWIGSAIALAVVGVTVKGGWRARAATDDDLTNRSEYA
jgi:hypothetical protein